MSKSILVCDDDQVILELIQEFLEQHHFQVVTTQNGSELLSILEEARTFDVILLDIMLQGEDGLSLCKKIRAKSEVPIIMITAVNNDIDRVAALEIGADYYMTKPINVRVLLAYIKTILRRHSSYHKKESEEDLVVKGETYTFQGWVLKVNERSLISPDNTRVTLSYSEFQMLLEFVKRPRCVLTRDNLLDAALQREVEPYDRTIDVLMSRLRRKLRVHANRNFNVLKTIRGVGYMLDCEVTKSNA